MEQYIMNADGLSYVDASIGIELADGSFIIADTCVDTLQELATSLEKEDTISRPLRRRLAFVDVINKSIIPLLLHIEENKCEVDTDQIFYLSMKLLANLSQPLDCLMIPENYQHPSLHEVVTEINQLLYKTKKAFLNPQVTKVIFGELQHIFLDLQLPNKGLSDQAYQAIDYSIYLYRNLLYIQDPETANELPMNMRIIKGMFQHGLKDVFFKMLTIEHRDFWCVSIIQLISLLFKDKRCVNFGPGPLNNCGEMTKSAHNRNIKNSGDQGRLGQPENRGQNTGPCQSVNCGEPSETSLNNDKERTSSPSGNETEVDMDIDAEMARAISKASLGKCETQAVAPQCHAEKEEGMKNVLGEEANRNKLEDDDTTNEANISLKDMICHLRVVLSDFAREFIKNGWGELLKSVKAVLVNQKKNRYQLEGHYFMWLVQYFLKLAHTLDIPFQHVKDCLSIDIIGLLVSLSVTSCEDISKECKKSTENNTHQEGNMLVLGTVRKNYLTVVAILQVLQSMNYFHSDKLSAANRRYLSKLQNSIIQMTDLRLLFVLLLRHYKQELHGKQYLIDVVTANHEFLLITDVVMSWGEKYKHYDILEHVRNFGTSELMLKYSSILDGFKTNPAELNDRVFTMMHHVAGDCQCPEALIQIPIVQNFLNILDNPMMDCIPPECCDLMEYILQSCLGKLQANSLDCIRLLCGLDFEMEGMNALKEDDSDEKKDCNSEVNSSWTQEEEDELFMLYSKLKKPISTDRLLSEVVSELNTLNIKKSIKQVEQHLHKHGLLQDIQFSSEDHLLRQNRKDPSDQIEHATIDQCVKILCEAKKDKLVHWLQGTLVEACFVKSGSYLTDCSGKPAEPTILHYTALGKSLPLVAFTEFQSDGLKNKHFLKLLQLLGFHMPEDNGDMYPRMPSFWMANDLFNKASLLGPAACQDSMRINLYSIDAQMECSTEDTQTVIWDNTNSEETSPVSLPSSLWPYIIQRTNIGNAKQGRLNAKAQ